MKVNWEKIASLIIMIVFCSMIYGLILYVLMNERKEIKQKDPGYSVLDVDESIEWSDNNELIWRKWK